MLEFRNVYKQYKSGMFGTYLTNAVDNVSFTITANERLGLLGESGCGKSTIAHLATKLLFPSKGQILFNGQDIRKMSTEEMKACRRNVQIVFQNPQQAFNPRMKLYETIAEPIRLYNLAGTRSEENEIISRYMSLLGLSDDILTRYPHEISGGQAQRIAIMRIVMLKPSIIIADEPTTMLDVSVQAQILNLLQDVMNENNTSLLFVSHDLDVIKAMCKTIMVMKDGKICETNTVESIFEHPKDEYTKFLVGKCGVQYSVPEFV